MDDEESEDDDDDASVGVNAGAETDPDDSFDSEPAVIAEDEDGTPDSPEPSREKKRKKVSFV
jgi:hypothetical protein